MHMAWCATAHCGALCDHAGHQGLQRRSAVRALVPCSNVELLEQQEIALGLQRTALGKANGAARPLECMAQELHPAARLHQDTQAEKHASSRI